MSRIGIENLAVGPEKSFKLQRFWYYRDSNYRKEIKRGSYRNFMMTLNLFELWTYLNYRDLNKRESTVFEAIP